MSLVESSAEDEETDSFSVVDKGNTNDDGGDYTTRKEGAIEADRHDTISPHQSVKSSQAMLDYSRSSTTTAFSHLHATTPPNRSRSSSIYDEKTKEREKSTGTIFDTNSSPFSKLKKLTSRLHEEDSDRSTQEDLDDDKKKKGHFLKGLTGLSRGV